jgi:hypothetical protein
MEEILIGIVLVVIAVGMAYILWPQRVSSYPGRNNTKIGNGQARHWGD